MFNLLNAYGGQTISWTTDESELDFQHGRETFYIVSELGMRGAIPPLPILLYGMIHN